MADDKLLAAVGLGVLVGVLAGVALLFLYP